MSGSDLISSTFPAGEDELATYAGAKRRIAALEQQLLNLQEGGPKRKSEITSNVTQGRVICRLVSMFQTIDELVEENDRRRSIQAEGEENVQYTLEENRTMRGYEQLIRYIPSIKTKLVDLDVPELTRYFRELRKGAGGARGDDAGNLKADVVSWITLLFKAPTIPLSPDTKMDRGFEHDDTGRLLCPIEYDWEDESVRTKIRDGHPDFPITADSWPAFLFPRGQGNIDDLEKGLFRSAILVKAYKHVFTSPTSARDIDGELDNDNQVQSRKRRKLDKASTRGHVANLLGMKSVTPRSIAYIAVQLRFALSNVSAWNENDGCFSYANFYGNIVDFFENPPGIAAQAQVTKLLSWWTSKVFGAYPAGQPQSHTDSSVSKLASQRAARELVAGENNL